MFILWRYFRSASLILCGLIFMFCASRPAQALDELTITLYKAEVFEMPEGTSTLIVGNPLIADITLLKKGNKILITGKGFGETNVLAIDTEGNVITETRVRVVSSNEHNLIAQRGTERESYSCSPRCLPTVNLGDSPAFISQTTSQIQTHASASTSR